MDTPKRGFRLPAETLGQLEALAALDSPGRPNATATLCRIISAAYRGEAALLGAPPEPPKPKRATVPKPKGSKR